MNVDFPLEAECCICEKYTEAKARDADMDGAICKECFPHLVFAQKVILKDLTQCGILK